MYRKNISVMFSSDLLNNTEMFDRVINTDETWFLNINWKQNARALSGKHRFHLGLKMHTYLTHSSTPSLYVSLILRKKFTINACMFQVLLTLCLCYPIYALSPILSTLFMNIVNYSLSFFLSFFLSLFFSHSFSLYIYNCYSALFTSYFGFICFYNHQG